MPRIPQKDIDARVHTITDLLEKRQRVTFQQLAEHLKAYASLEPLVQDTVDPRFRFVTRGIAPLVDQLSGRWSSDPNYGQKILAIVRRLYESADLM